MVCGSGPWYLVDDDQIRTVHECVGVSLRGHEHVRVIEGPDSRSVPLGSGQPSQSALSGRPSALDQDHTGLSGCDPYPNELATRE